METEKKEEITNPTGSEVEKEFNLDNISDEDIQKALEEDTTEKNDDKLVEDTEIDLGELGKMKLSDVKKGIMLHKDYTQKTQVLAEERKKIDESKTNLEEFKKYNDFLTAHPDVAEKISVIVQEVSAGGITKKEGDEQIKEVVKEEQEAKPEDTELRKNVGELNLKISLIDLHSWTKESFPEVEYKDDDIIDEAVRLGTTNLQAAFKSKFFDKAVELGKTKLIADLKENKKLKVGTSEDKGGKKEEPVIVKDFDDAGEQAKQMLGEI